MTRSCTHEIIALILRGYDTPEPPTDFHTPYTNVITVIGDEGFATLKGFVADRLTKGDLEVCDRKLAELGFHTRLFVRWRDGRKMVRVRRLKGVAQ